MKIGREGYVIYCSPEDTFVISCSVIKRKVNGGLMDGLPYSRVIHHVPDQFTFTSLDEEACAGSRDHHDRSNSH